MSKPIIQQIRKVLLDLLSEYQNLEKPANPELLKLHIEAYEDQILALFNTHLESVLPEKLKYDGKTIPKSIISLHPTYERGFNDCIDLIKANMKGLK